MKRRSFIKGIPLTASFVASGIEIKKPFELEETTISELQKKMQDGSLTSEKITNLYLERINQLDKNGPRLNAIIQLNPDAVAIAKKMDDERKAGKTRGALHGIPVLIKDNINSADKMMTTAGSLALLNHIAPKDAFIVQKLREAGAVILGKSNCTEWSNFRAARASSGWSSRGGQTKNPCVLDRSPSGSSSGSGAAVAANLCAVSIGTETDGSIVSPSSFNGIVGLKPTVGLWSRSGIIPISKTQDTAGPMARTVSDVATLLGALCGEDSEDEITLTSRGKFAKDYTKYLDANALQNARIGVEKSFFEGHQDVVALYRSAIDILKSKGATIIEIDLMKPFYEVNYQEFLAFQYEFKDGVNRYLTKNNAKLKSLEEIIAFNEANESTVMPYCKQEILVSSQAKGPVTSPEYIETIKKRQKALDVVNGFFDEHKLSAVCAPSTGLPCAIDVINGDADTGFYFCAPAAVCGFPHITVPMGKVHELPVGFSFMGKAFAEGTVIGLAYAYEQATNKREVPKFIATTIP